MRRLRDPETGCPWDVKQSFATIAPYTIEEAYEVAAAIEDGDLSALKEELGDLLLQVVFHARMAEEAGLFAFDDVAAAIADKMVRRHPHVFGDAEIASVAAQNEAWEAHKAAERLATGAGDSVLDGVALALPALLRAAKVSRRAARIGFDWPDADSVIDKIEEELDEIEDEIDGEGPKAALEEEIGDLLFAAHVPALDGSIKGWLALLDSLKSQQYARAVPGHGPASMPWPDALKPIERYLTTVADDVRRAIKDGRTLAEATKTAGQSEKQSWELFDEFNARNVSSAFHELEWE